MWGVLGPSGPTGPPGLQDAKPRSWLTLGECLLVQFALFFALCLVVFSTLHPELYFKDFGAILNTFSTTFGELSGAKKKQRFLQSFWGK